MNQLKVLTIGRDLPVLHRLLEQSNIRIVDTDPEVVITHGGDGYLLDAERQYPGIPKLAIRHNSVCKMCVNHETSHLIKLLAQNKLSKIEVAKLETEIAGQKLTALNEFSLYHQRPNQAIRFAVQVNDDHHVKEAIGDGVIVATSFGSHAYYRSITNSTFRLGIGIAFNNTTEAIDHTVVRDSDTVTVSVTRGPAYFLSDNDQNYLSVDAGAEINIRQSDEKAILLGLDHFHCPDCGEIDASIGVLTEAGE